MFRFRSGWRPAACAALLAGPAWAQQAPPPAPPVRSALDGYQRFEDATPSPWKAANETVGRIGGWKAYAREAAEGRSTTAPAAPAPAPAPQGHGQQHSGGQR